MREQDGVLLTTAAAWGRERPGAFARWCENQSNLTIVDGLATFRAWGASRRRPAPQQSPAEPNL